LSCSADDDDDDDVKATHATRNLSKAQHYPEIVDSMSSCPIPVKNDIDISLKLGFLNL
jgi:hypothetical protein